MTEPLEVVLVGGGERASAWLVPLQRSSRLRLVANVTRSDATLVPDRPHYRSLDAAGQAYPTAAFAVALPPRAGLEAALWLMEHDRAGVLEAPLHDRLSDLSLPSASTKVRVAHGWVTLPGLSALQTIMRRVGKGQLILEAAGLPEAPDGDLSEQLVHGSALLRALLPQLAVAAARCVDGGLEVEANAGDWQATMRILPRGRRLAVRVHGTETALWSWDDDRETISLGERTLVAARATPPASVRALAQLLPDAARGDDLAEAAAALRIARACLALLPSQLPLGARALRQSAAIAARRPGDLVGQVGLVGLVGQVGPVGHVGQVGLVGQVQTPEPFELWAFRAGIKPVVFLTVRPEEVDGTLAYFGEVFHERRDRRVQIDAQDRWTDRRDTGEPRVELYISRDPELARRAAHLQAEVDPTRAIREIGALVGYPECCVDAFARQDDRANNTHNRYQSQARTRAPDGSTHTPWPWELNNLHTTIVPFYPCSYRCEPGRAWAAAAFAEMAKIHPELANRLHRLLAQPVLYFDHDHQLVFAGEFTGGAIEYRTVSLVRAGSTEVATLAAVIAEGDRLTLDEQWLTVERAGKTLGRMRRTDPGLGFIAPFA